MDKQAQRFSYSVSEETRNRLEGVKAEIEAKLGLKVTQLAVITFLLNFYDNNKDSK
jgi:hypothetical protein